MEAMTVSPCPPILPISTEKKFLRILLTDAPNVEMHYISEEKWA
jgi:hypothetical protein